MKKIKNIAIIAFDSNRTDLIEWSYFNQKVLNLHKITALGFAGKILEGTLNTKINTIEPGNFGGYKQLCALINDGLIDVLIIFGEVQEIFKNKFLTNVVETAIQQNILVAANRTTADFLVHSTLIDSEYTISKKEERRNAAVVDTTTTTSLAKAS